MESLARIMTALVPLLGIASGLLISRYTKNEIKQGRKYLNTLCHLLLAILVAIVVANYHLLWAIPEGLALFLLLLFFRIEHKYRVIPLLAINSILYPATAIITFLYNMTVVSLQYKNIKKLGMAAALYTAITLAIALLL